MLWIGAFCFAVAIFLAVAKRLDFFPPTQPMAAGRVVAEGVSKLRDYATAALFMVFVPAVTIALRRGARSAMRSLAAPLVSSDRLRQDSTRMFSLVLFTLPLFLAPLLHVATRKELWSLLLPLVLALAAPATVRLYATQSWFRELASRSLASHHGLVFAEGAAWILFRYLAVGKRIAHIDSLLLESLLVLVLLFSFWGVVVVTSRTAGLLLGRPPIECYRQISLGAAPLLLLPVLGLTLLSAGVVLVVTLLAVSILTALLMIMRSEPRPIIVERLLVWVAVPLLLFALSYASTATLSRWVDLFHRGESIGPASDYLRGKRPFLDVLPLHGLLEDGLLDAGLMTIFGRSAEVSAHRAVILSSMMLPAVWILGWVVFGSLPLALATAALGLVMSADNQRAVFELFALALLLASVRRESRWMAFGAGSVAALALFFSLDTGLYTVAAALLAFAMLPVISRDPEPRRLARLLVVFLAGVFVASLPFLALLASHGALKEFVEISFITIPGLVDAVWSLPYPDLLEQARQSPGTRSLFDVAFTLRFLINPLVIALAILVVIRRGLRRDGDGFDRSFAILAVFALVTQRSALGRADFPHQWFSAFLIGPLIIALLVVLWRATGELRRTARPGAQVLLAAVAAIAIPASLALLWVPGLVGQRLSDTVAYRNRMVGGEGFEDAPGKISARRIERVSAAIRELSNDQDFIFDFSNQPAFYFFADRPNPTRFYQAPILSAEAFQLEAIRDLERTAPAVILMSSPEGYHRFDGITNEQRAPMVAAWIHHHYGFERNAEGVELWTRRRELDASFDPRQSFIPPEDAIVEDVSDAHVVFPGVGSLSARGAEWKSDLLVTNAGASPIRIRLRYRSAEVTSDRRLLLEPGETRRFEDVAASWFDAPGTRGVLWLTVPADRNPLVRLATRDAVRDLPASFHPPLSADDAAQPGETLVVFGVRSSPELRLHLDVVNLADEVAGVGIEVRNAEGEILGKTLEAKIEERGSLLLVDLPARLETSIDETMQIRVVPASGMLVAQLSVVDGATGALRTIPAIPVAGQ